MPTMPDCKRLARLPRILIVSDQDQGLRQLERFLGQHGYAVLRVYAGAPALERAREVHPDVIFLDAKLVDRDSLALGRALRDDPQIGMSTPILLLTTGHPKPRDHLADRFRRAMPTGRLWAGYDAVGNVRYTPIEPNEPTVHAARALQLAKAEGKWIRAFG